MLLIVFWVENYGQVLKDCAQAIQLDPTAVKAYYRSAKAARLLQRFDDALDACRRGLNVSLSSFSSLFIVLMFRLNLIIHPCFMNLNSFNRKKRRI